MEVSVKRSENTTKETAGRWMWESVRQKAAAAGEEVLWESTGGHGRKSVVLSDDLHGHRRWQRTAAFVAAVGMAFAAGLLHYSTDGDETAGYILGLLLVSAFFLWVGRKLSKAVFEDSKRRFYLLTDHRLFVIGEDSYADIPLADMEWVNGNRHRDGSGTVVCRYDSLFVGESVSVEGIEDYETVEGLIEAHSPALLGGYWQIALPLGIKRRIRGVREPEGNEAGAA